MAVVVEQGLAAEPSRPLLKRMFEDRKSVFVDLLKWDLPVLDGRFEVDAFDNAYATYVIVATGDDEHLGSARLLPTSRPHILASLFPSLCDNAPPQGGNVREITRFCLSRRQNASARQVTRNRLISALVWHALETGIRTYTGVAEIAWLQQILAFGWDCRPLGSPARFDCGMLGALAIEIDEKTPDLLAANGIWDLAADPSARIAEAA